MLGQRVRTWVRAAFAICGLGLIATALVIALHGVSELTSLAAVLTGVLLIVIGGTGRLPGEIGLQRITFNQSTDASAYQQAFYEAVREELPHLRPPVPGPIRHTSQLWVDELQVRIVVTWAADDSCRFDVSMVEPVIEQAPGNVPVILVTNVDDIEDVRAALRARHGDRAAVVRWKSQKDNEALRRAAHRLSTVLPMRHKPRTDEHGLPIERS
jgi:hypothetical protein